MSDEGGLRDILANYQLDHVADGIISLAKPSIGIDTRPISNEAELPVGASKLGGSPDLPAEWHWPTWETTPLSFIAQLNMSEVHTFDAEGVLPHAGILYFFYDKLYWLRDDFKISEISDFDGGWRVLFYDAEDMSVLRRTATPAELVASEHGRAAVLTPCKLGFARRLTLPTAWSDGLPHDNKLMIELTEDEVDAYWGVLEDLKEDKPAHRLLGHANAFQDEPLLECIYLNQRLRSEGNENQAELEEISQWRLLLQIDSDDSIGMIWGINGMIYYCIPKQALRETDFGRVCLCLQDS